jgi:signal peptidase I
VRRSISIRRERSLQRKNHKTKIVSSNINAGFFSQRITSSLVTRIPAFMLVLLILNDEQYSPIPITFELMVGPSMLPTIFPEGECYLRVKTWFLSEDLKVGDIIVFKDLKGGLACKRIVGLEGDTVDRFGEYHHLFQDESDFGIRKIPMKFKWEDSIGVKKIDGRSTVKVPPGKLWVEGDNPLHSVDSRHYGPIEASCIRGKVVYRLWPRQREDSSHCEVKSVRPHPLTETEMMNEPYNIASVPSSK